jgi:trigger factor
MEIAINPIDSLRKEVTATFTAEEVNNKIRQEYDEILTYVDIRGFRKGHVPMSILERRYGDDVLSEVEGHFKQESLNKVVKDNNWELLAMPSFKNEDLQKDKEFVLHIVIDLRPKMELPDFKTVEIQKHKVNVSDEDVNNAILETQKQFGQLVVVENEESKKDDTLVGDVVVYEDGKEEAVINEQNFELSLEREKCYVKYLPMDSQDFYGKKSGDEVKKDATRKIGDEEKLYHVTFKVTNVKRHQLHELNDEFFQNFHVHSLEELKSITKENLMHEAQHKVESEVENNIWNAMLEKVSYEDPVSFINERVAESKFGFIQNKFREMHEKDADLTMEKAQPEIDAAWEKEQEHMKEHISIQLKEDLILSKLAEELHVKVNDSEVDEMVKMFALYQQQPVAKVREYMERSGQLDAMISQITKSKVCKHLEKEITCTEID